MFSLSYDVSDGFWVRIHLHSILSEKVHAISDIKPRPLGPSALAARAALRAALARAALRAARGGVGIRHC